MALIKTMKQLLAFGLIALSTQLSYAEGEGGINFFKGSFDEALKVAEEEGKLIFLDAYASWCGPCKRMAANVFPQAEVGAFYNEHFINLKMDMEKGEGPKLARAYRVSAYPTLFYLDSEGQIVHKTMGAKSPYTLIEEGKKALLPGPSLVKRVKDQYEAGDRSPETLGQYAEILFKSGEEHDAVFGEFLSAVEADQILTDRNCKLVLMLTDHPASPGVETLRSYRKYYSDVHTDRFYKTVERIAEGGIERAIAEKNWSGYTSSTAMLKEFGHPEKKKLGLELGMKYYAGVGQWNKYHEHASKFKAKYIKGNEQEMVKLLGFYRDKVEDPAAIGDATEWTEALLDKKDSYANNLLHAQLLNKLGLKEDALVFAQLAEKKAAAEGVNPQLAKQLIHFIQKEQ